MKNLIYFAVMFLFLFCSQKEQSAVEYMNELSAQLQLCTNEAEYDKVYYKIIALKHDERFSKPCESREEDVEIVTRLAVLTHEALAVKAILYVMPSSVTPTEQEMAHFFKECMDKRLNVIAQPYGDVRDMVYNYYKIER